MLSQELRTQIEQYVEERYTEPPIAFAASIRPPEPGAGLAARRVKSEAEKNLGFMLPPRPMSQPRLPALDEAVAHLGESFSDMLLRKIDEKGITDAECYRKAHLDRRLFSKIRSNKGYQPSKPTVLACAIALELPLDEAEEMLQTAGFAFSPASRSDLIVEFFIEKGRYNLLEINEALFDFGEKTLGS